MVSGSGSLTTSTGPSRTGSPTMPDEAVVRRPRSNGTDVPKNLSVLPPSATSTPTGPSDPDLIMQGVVRTCPSLEYSQTLPLWDLAMMSNMVTASLRMLLTVAMGPHGKSVPTTLRRLPTLIEAWTYTTRM